MKFFELLFNYSKYDDATCLETREMYGIDRYDLEKGNKINFPEKFMFYYNSRKSNKFIDYQGNDLGWLVVSNKLKDIFTAFNCNKIQFIPIKIKDEATGTIRTDYFLVNIFNVITDLFDYENSKFVGIKPKKNEPLKSVRFYAFKEKATDDLYIFKIKENTFPVFISGKVKKEIENNNIQGCDFKKVILV